jgi:hypothetical protein
MSNLRIVPQNFIADDDSVIEASPAMEVMLPETNIQLIERSAVARSTSLADQVIRGHHKSNARTADSFFMFNQKGYGGSFRLQLWQFPDWSTSVYDSGTLPIGAALVTPESMNYNPLGIPSDDLLAMEAPVSLFFPAVGYAAWTLTLTGCKHLYWELGTVFLGKYLEAPYNPDEGMQFGWQSNTEHERSRGGSLGTIPGERWAELTADMFLASEADRAAWRDVLARIDYRPFAMSVFPGVGGRQERDYVALMKNVTHSPFAWRNTNINETTFKFAGC